MRNFKSFCCNDFLLLFSKMSILSETVKVALSEIRRHWFYDSIINKEKTKRQKQNK